MRRLVQKELGTEDVVAGPLPFPVHRVPPPRSILYQAHRGKRPGKDGLVDPSLDRWHTPPNDFLRHGRHSS